MCKIWRRFKDLGIECAIWPQDAKVISLSFRIIQIVALACIVCATTPLANIISVNGRLANQESKQYKGSRRQRIQVYNHRPNTHAQLVATFRSPIILAHDNLFMSPKLILANVGYWKKYQKIKVYVWLTWPYFQKQRNQNHNIFFVWPYSTESAAERISVWHKNEPP